MSIIAQVLAVGNTLSSFKFNVGLFPGYPQGGMEYQPEKKFRTCSSDTDIPTT